MDLAFDTPCETVTINDGTYEITVHVIFNNRSISILPFVYNLLRGEVAEPGPVLEELLSESLNTLRKDVLFTQFSQSVLTAIAQKVRFALSSYLGQYGGFRLLVEEEQSH